MNFRRGRHREELEINFVPLIDVLLVVLIFVMATTTYSRFSELQITLPDAEAQEQTKRPKEISVAIDSSGRVAIDRQIVNLTGVAALSDALKAAAQGATDPVIIINADAQATHQSVINVMEAARLAQIQQITFATQSQKAK